MHPSPILAPALFEGLIRRGCIAPRDICGTDDGFRAVRVSVADILAARGVTEFCDSDGHTQPCSLYFDDWYLYAAPYLGGHVYSLFKLREQEYDGGDGDTPGVTVSFISFEASVLTACLDSPTPQVTADLNREINRVVAHSGQVHHPALKAYFDSAAAQGPYLIAKLYVRHAASFAVDGALPVPLAYAALYDRVLSGSAKADDRRLPDFIDENNHRAGRTVCDHRQIFLRDPQNLSREEEYAILATHTADTSYNCFAAEVQFHARFLFGLTRIPIPFMGRSVYDSAIRADMTINDTEFEGPAPYHNPHSRWVKQQLEFHEEY